MNKLTEFHCPECQSLQIEPFKKYNTVHNGERSLLKCDECDNVFFETAGTPMQDIKSPISKVTSVLKIGSEGMGLRATARVLGMHENTVSTWERLFGDQQETLMLYSFCHEFVSLVFEGDELCTVVGRRTDAHASEGGQKHKRGPKLKKYQAPPLREHPEIDQELDESNIHEWVAAKRVIFAELYLSLYKLLCPIG